MYVIFASLVASLARAVDQIYPPDGATLTTTQVLFQWESEQQVDYYELEITLIGESGGRDSIIAPISIDHPHAILSYIFEFGRSYSWRCRSVGSNGIPGSWGSDSTFRIKQLPSEPVVETEIHNELSYQPGINLCNDEKRHAFWGFDQKGTIIFFYAAPYATEIKLLPNGRLMHVSSWRVKETTLDGKTEFLDLYGEYHHDAYPMPGGEVLTILRTKHQLPLDDATIEWHVDNIVHYDRELNLIWEWATLDHISTDDVSYDHVQLSKATGYLDWTHTNACLYDSTDNSVIISVRNLSRLIKIDYETKAIMWSMGAELASGETMFGDGFFSYQHAPELLPNGNILLYDNGGNELAESMSTSRAIEIALLPDSVNPDSAVIIWEYDLGFFTSSMGDADRLPNGNTLITAGDKPNNKCTIVEIDKNNNVVWTLSGDFHAYRTDRVPCLYPHVIADDESAPGFTDIFPTIW
jgi:hypothetical protein